MLDTQALFTTKGLVFAGFLPYPDSSIPPGAANFLAGESGCGKSSLLKMFNGTVSPTAGEIFYCGRTISDMPTLQLRRQVLLVGQEAYLFPATIWENVKSFCKYRSAGEPSQEEFSQFLEMCCLSLPMDYDCLQLSGGERQRLFLAIHLYFKPETILLDEPTSALDNETATRLMGNITDFCRTKKINTVIISHSPEITKKFAENIIQLEKRSSDG